MSGKKQGTEISRDGLGCEWGYGPKPLGVGSPYLGRPFLFILEYGSGLGTLTQQASSREGHRVGL